MPTSHAIQSQAIKPENESVNGAVSLVRALEAQGVEYVFGYPGGAIMPVYDALYDSSLKHILCRHEQGCALAADGYARVTGKVGVCMATSGPGATNLITGIANAYMDSVPLLAITGQVPTSVMGTDAFQEVDIFSMTMAVVKHSYIVRHSDDIPAVVAEAIELAQSGRPGPVLIDIPKDVAAGNISGKRHIPAEPPSDIANSTSNNQAALELIRSAEKPLLYIGGGAAIAGVENELRELAQRSGIPAVSTLKGLGVLAPDSEYFLGMLGMHGNQAANKAVQSSDLLIAIGVRFDDRATGKLDEFAPHAKILHIEVDAAEIAKLRAVDVALHGDLNDQLSVLDELEHQAIAAWQRECKKLIQEFSWRYDYPNADIYAPLLLKRLSEKASDDLIISCDVGQHQMWVAQHCAINHPSQHLSSAGLGTMGYGLPAGVGAQFAKPDAPVVVVSGDGSIMMNIQELATLKRYQLPVKILLLDNSALGLVRQWQDLFFEGRRSEVDLSDNPDFCEVFATFGLHTKRISQANEIEEGLDFLLNTNEACLLHVIIDKQANVWPLVPPGKSNDSMMDESY
ncbi:MAG: acetolactate synthase 2 catalytic subunit [Gammaproteobacteria bacterium]|nr:acetolactate synthase 2 catalytic subunit [Gammaproteobacteria bacterium]